MSVGIHRGSSNSPALHAKGSRSSSRPSSLDNSGWIQHEAAFPVGNPQPLLAEVLAGGPLSNEALLDLHVSLGDNLSLQCVP